MSETDSQKRWLVAIYQEYSIIRGDSKHSGAALHSRISVVAKTAQDAVTLGVAYIKASEIPNAYVSEVVREDLVTVRFDEPFANFSQSL